jgi:hypothetical protein
MVAPIFSSQVETGLAFKSQNYINALEIEQNKNTAILPLLLVWSSMGK